MLTSRIDRLFALCCSLVLVRWDVVGHLQGYGRAVDVHFTTVGSYDVSTAPGAFCMCAVCLRVVCCRTGVWSVARATSVALRLP